MVEREREAMMREAGEREQQVNGVVDGGDGGTAPVAAESPAHGRRRVGE